jgi:mRNA interferase YafQ
MKRDVRRMILQHKDMSKLQKVLDLLCEEKRLPPEYKDHQLKGRNKDFRECHIEPDWLLMYQIDRGRLILFATATGSHSEILERLVH